MVSRATARNSRIRRLASARHRFLDTSQAMSKAANTKLANTHSPLEQEGKLHPDHSVRSDPEPQLVWRLLARGQAQFALNQGR